METTIERQLQDLNPQTINNLINVIAKKAVATKLKSQHVAKSISEGWFILGINNLNKQRNKYYKLTKNILIIAAQKSN